MGIQKANSYGGQHVQICWRVKIQGGVSSPFNPGVDAYWDNEERKAMVRGGAVVGPR